MKKKIIIFGATFLMASCAIRLAWSDEIEFNGRTEAAQCKTYTSVPTDVEVCSSESWICRIQGGDIQCSVKR